MFISTEAISTNLSQSFFGGCCGISVLILKKRRKTDKQTTNSAIQVMFVHMADNVFHCEHTMGDKKYIMNF